MDYTGTPNNDHIVAGPGDDFIQGLAGNDWLEGGDGSDTIEGGTGNDTVLGGEDDDFLAGGAGNDLIDGGASGYDTVVYGAATGPVVVDLEFGFASGADGDDTLIGLENAEGSAYADSITGDDYDNYLSGLGGNDTLAGGWGYDEIYGDDGNDVIDGGEDDDYLYGGNGNDNIDGGDGYNQIEGGAGNDTIVAGWNDDYISGDAGNDSIDGGDGWNDLDGGAGNDTLVGGADDDDIFGDTGNDSIAGGDGDDEIDGDEGDDTVLGAGGDDVLWGWYGNDSIDGGDGEDYIDGEDGDDKVAGGAGEDQVYGSTGNDSLSGDAGDDAIDGESGNDTVRGGADNDYLAGGSGNDLIDGGTGVDTASFLEGATAGVIASLVTNLATGGAGNDTLVAIENLDGSAYSDQLIGNTADNELFGDDGNDTIQAGSGNDKVWGGAGNDVLDGGAGTDKLSFSDALAGVTASLATGTASGSGNDTFTGFEAMSGSAYNDLLTGDAGPNVIEGNGGKDTLRGGDGNDALYGNLGQDRLDGGFGNDTLDGGSDNNLLSGQFDYVLYDQAPSGVTVNLALGIATGPMGTDTLIGIEAIDGSDYADTLIGDGNDNQFRGNKGNDTFTGGAGNDWVSYFDSDGPVVVSLVTGTASGSDGNDQFTSIEAISGSLFADLLTGDSGNNWLRGNEGNDTLSGGAGSDAADYSNATAGVTVNLALATSSGPDGVDVLISIENVYGSALYADVLIGSSGPNYMDGRNGNDTIQGGDGDDTIRGGTDNDSMDGGAGNDVAVYVLNFDKYTVSVENGNNDLIVSGAEGTDRLRNFEVIQFADRNFVVQQGGAGAETLSVSGLEDGMIHGKDGDDSLVGSSGNDALYGDAGSDSLQGAAGDDLLDGGDGADTMAGSTGNDTYIVNNSNDVVIEIADLGLPDEVGDNPGGGVDTVIASINYTLGNFLNNLILANGAGNLAGAGNALANALTGNGGNNMLTGNAGNDTIEGGDGVDTAAFSGNRIAYTLGPLGQASVTVSSTTDGNDTLSGIERLQFADGRYAIDTKGSTGLAIKLIQTLFGSSALTDKPLVGLYLALFDTGLTLESGMAVGAASDRFAQAAGSHTNTAFVNLVYQNALGSAPDANTRAYLVGLLDNGTVTQALMATLAAGYVKGTEAFPAGIAYELASAGTTGTTGNDTLVGGTGNDVLTGLAGNDLIVGAAGIDRAVYTTAKSLSTVTANSLGLVVKTGAETDQLVQVERITYSNISVAYDLDANAGMAAKLVGAMFGPAALQDEALVGTYLALLDSGTGYEAAVGIAAASVRFGNEAGGHSNAQFVDRVYFNLTGIHPSVDTAAPLVSLLATPGYTQAWMGTLAADTSYNVANVNLTGLAQTGLEYIVS